MTTGITGMRSLNGKQILHWIHRHGGLSRIHVRPFADGWVNTLVCEDGEKLTTSKDQDIALIREMDREESGR